ncbi:MAG: DUF4178 domain-containing protein [Candidatus Berkiella sp.]
MAGKYLHPEHNATPPSVEQIACVKCGGALTLRAKGYSTTVICPYCNALYKVTAHGLEIEGMSLSQHQRQIEPLIPLGTRGKLHGATWEVIGFMQRRSSLNVTWQEYLLFNPYKGFRWLTECLGHWNYVLAIHDVPKPLLGDSMSYLDQKYVFYSTYYAAVLYVIGEFYWRVKANDTCSISDYVAGPNILSKEKQESEEIWSLAEYIEPETVKAAFNLNTMPAKVGATINQPFKQSKELSALITSGVIGCILVAVVGLFILIGSRHTPLVYGELTAKIEQKAQSLALPPPLTVPEVKNEITTPSFEITDDNAFLSFSLQAPVNNNWVDVDATLINEQTGKALYFSNGLEFYSGYDSDGYWSEGKKEDSIVLSALPKGKYHLVFEATTNDPNGITVKYQFKQGAFNSNNYFFSLFLMLLPTAFGLAYYFYFNYQREIS